MQEKRRAHRVKEHREGFEKLTNEVKTMSYKAHAAADSSEKFTAQTKKRGVRTNENRVNIEPFIEVERTAVFENLAAAQEAARKQRSYFYQVYRNGKTTGEYAVPK